MKYLQSHTNKYRVLTKELQLRTKRIQRSCRGLRLPLSCRPLAKHVKCLKSEPQNNHKHHNLKHKCSVVSKANVQLLWKYQLLYLMSCVNRRARQLFSQVFPCYYYINHHLEGLKRELNVLKKVKRANYFVIFDI